jgi:hypothetical protein
VTVKGRGSADEAVVVVKLGADEDTVTYLRGKLSASGTRKRVLEAKGGTCNRDFQNFIWNYRQESSRKGAAVRR